MPEFLCARQIVVPAAPERLWEAISTENGNAGWLFPNVLDPGCTAVWEPSRHLRSRIEQGDWFNELEFVIDDRGDGTSGLSYRHNGVFPAEDFTAQEDGVQHHTDFYLHTLIEYLGHFDGRPATYVSPGPGGIQAPDTSATPDGFTRLQRALGLSPHTAAGDAVDLSPHGVEPITGVVDYLTPHFMGIRTTDALYRFFGRNAWGGPVAVTIHAFDGRDAGRAQQDWERFLRAAFATAEAPAGAA